jgi:acetyl esterase/lipase
MVRLDLRVLGDDALGGGLEGGNKEIPPQLREKDMVVVGVNYRLLPRVTVTETLDDAAEAVAWVFKHIGQYGGDPSKIVVTGHSAGGYLSMMLCLDKSGWRPMPSMPTA